MALAAIGVTLIAWGCHEVGEVRLSRAFKRALERWRARSSRASAQGAS